MSFQAVSSLPLDADVQTNSSPARLQTISNRFPLNGARNSSLANEFYVDPFSNDLDNVFVVSNSFAADQFSFFDRVTDRSPTPSQVEAMSYVDSSVFLKLISHSEKLNKDSAALQVRLERISLALTSPFFLSAIRLEEKGWERKDT